jgi:ABC-type lipoprotein export system ATPase subunit
MLTLKRIYKSYNDSEVLSNIDIHFRNEEITLIMGSSGVGKSTLLNIAGCLIRPDSGIIEFENKKIDLVSTNTDKFRVNNFSYVFQNFNLLPEFNVYDNLLIPAYINNLDIENVRVKMLELLDYMNLGNIQKKFPSQLSSGEIQRIALLRSLLGKQKIIIADEPTGNLDESNTKIILNLIANINRDYKYMFIVASHDKSFLDIAHKSYFLNNANVETINE